VSIVSSDQLKAEIEKLGLLAEDEYRGRSAQLASRLGIDIDVLDVLYKAAREKHLKAMGAKALSEAFFEIESGDQALDRIARCDAQLRNDIGFAYADDFIKAAAALAHFDGGAFARLANNLKSRGLSDRTRWEETARRMLHQERDRLKLLRAPQGQSGGMGRSSQAATLVDLARAHAKFFHDGENTYASVEVSQHTENYDLKSRAFKRWLAQLHLTQTQKVPNAEGMGAAINTLSGIAQFRSPEWRVYVRVAGHGSAIYIDLGDADWRVVEITAAGWRVVPAKASPVMFRRAHGMLPLPEPAKGGNLDELRQLVNIPDDTDFNCYIACLIAAFRPHGPYPVLEIKGEQGSAKSTAQKYWRNLIDPNTAPLRRSPREPRDLAIAANNAWVVSVNNLSYLPDWLSDDLCCLSTGQGFAVRTLYSDLDEIIFAFQRPVVINGIEDIVVRGDLADRRLALCLPTIAGAYRTEKDLDQQFAKAAPRIFGRLLDIVSGALRRLPTTEVTNLPRMADFVTWIEAAAPSLGWERGAFAATYRAKVALGNAAVLEAPVPEVIIQKLDLPFEGPASELLKKLAGMVDKNVTRQKGWPKDATRLSSQLRRLAPDLRKVDIEIFFDDKARPRRLTINRVFLEAIGPGSSSNAASEASAASKQGKTQENKGGTADATSNPSNTPASEPVNESAETDGPADGNPDAS